MKSIYNLKDPKEEEREGYFYQDDEREGKEKKSLPTLCEDSLESFIMQMEEEENKRLYTFNTYIKPTIITTTLEETLGTLDSPYHYCCTDVCDMVKCSVPMCDQPTPQCVLHIGKRYCVDCSIIIEKLGTSVESMLKNPLYCQLCYHKISRKGSIAYCNKGCYLGRKEMSKRKRMTIMKDE